MQLTKTEFIDGLIEREGGDTYVNDPADSGGGTRFGITEAVARAYKYTGAMQDLPRELAVEIYAATYWDAVKADDLATISPEVCAEVVDTGVNMGVRRSAKFLQRTLNVLNNRGKLFPDVIVDGAIGPASLAALDAFEQHRGAKGLVVLVRALNCLQGAAYIELAERREKDEKFVYGWISARVD